MRSSRTVAWAATALGVASVASVALFASAPSAAAEGTPAHVSFTWSAPAGCPTESSVRADVERLLAGSQASVSARADVAHVGDSWRVVVAMNGGERKLEAGSCRALAEAAALIVAMAVDPARVAANRALPAAADAGALPEPDASSSEPADASAASSADGAFADASLADGGALLAPVLVPVASAPTVAADAAPPAAAGAPPSASPRVPGAPSSDAHGPRFALSAAGALDVGSLPAPAVGLSVAFAWTPRHFRLELAGGYFFPDSTPPSNNALVPGAIERFTLLTGTLRGCYVARPGPFDLGACLEAEVASAHGNGIGIANPSGGASAWFSPGAGLFGAWRFASSWALLARADALIPTRRPDFQVETVLPDFQAAAVTLHRPGVATGRFALGVELRF